MLTTFLSLASERFYSLRPDVFETLRSKILSDAHMGITTIVDRDECNQAFIKTKTGSSDGNAPMQMTDYMGDTERIKYWEDLEDDDNIVNLIRISGAITRGGDACSYGSMDIRDKMMRCADIKQTRAHILVVSTPGGAASAMRDFRFAINYCHDRGQKVYMFCVGDVASAGAFLGCMCDGIYALNPADEIGSLGMYAAFFTLKPNSENKITGETYREVYAEASKDKNLWFRKAAEGDMGEIEDDLNKNLSQALADLKQDRPSVKAEHMTGKMYAMGSVKGSLIDGFTTLNELAVMALSEHAKRNGAALPRKEQAAAPQPDGEAGCKPNKKTETINNETNMSKTYQNIGAAMGEEPLESDAQGYVTLQPEQADALEQVLHADDTLGDEITALKQTNIALEEKVKGLESNLAERDNSIAELNTSLNESQTVLTSKDEELRQTAQTIKDKDATIATHMQTISDLQAEIEEMKQGAGAQVDAGETPDTNGASLGTPVMQQLPEAGKALSPSQRKARREAYLKEQERKVYGK